MSTSFVSAFTGCWGGLDLFFAVLNSICYAILLEAEVGSAGGTCMMERTAAGHSGYNRLVSWLQLSS